MKYINKLDLKVKPIIVLLVIVLIITTFYIIRRSKVEITKEDRDRIDFVKETAVGYGMGNAIETTPDTIAEKNKNTDGILSFGKKQIYELIVGAGDDKESITLAFHKFESSKAGKKEAEQLYDAFKESINMLPDSDTKELTDSQTGNKIFEAKTILTNNTETVSRSEDGVTTTIHNIEIDTDILTILVYNAEKYEVVQLSHQMDDGSENVYDITEKILTDLGWEKGY